MSIFESIKKGIKATWEDYNTPESFKVGEAFENYTREILFPNDIYKMIHKTSDYRQNKSDFEEDALLPDYQFQCPMTGRKFYIECKFRRTAEEGVDLYEICTADQLKRYQVTDKKSPTLILVGIAFGWKDFTFKDMNKYGSPEDFFCTEVNFFLLPVNQLNTNVVNSDLLVDYAIAGNSPYSPKRLWQFYEDKLDSGFCIRCKKKILNNYGQPLCIDCFNQWYKFKNFTYKEKFCYACGKENNVSFAKPVCLSCYKEGR